MMCLERADKPLALLCIGLYQRVQLPDAPRRAGKKTIVDTIYRSMAKIASA